MLLKILLFQSKSKMDISSLSWEERGRVFRVLFTMLLKILLFKSKSKMDINLSSEDCGRVAAIKDGIVIVESGLTKVFMSELVEFENIDRQGIVSRLGKKKYISVLGGMHGLRVGSIVRRLYKLPHIKVSDQLLGRVVDPLGMPLDGKGVHEGTEISLIEKKAPGIIDREAVRDTLETGVKFLDSMIPIGKGQRELIIGDPKTGKTTLAIDTILNQKGKNVLCVYVMIGQKQSSLLKILKTLEKNDCLKYTVVVLASAADAAILQYLAPFSGCSIAEYFLDQRKDVLIVYDDLSKHAKAYRQMSLLLRRPPGREGYPGDVFYLHSRLLERACKLKNNREVVEGHVINGGSLTAFPIAETVDGDISAYIPTNIISITDGQVFLEVNLFNQGVRPAINSGESVSRIGGAAQSKVMKNLAGFLKLELTQYREIVGYLNLGLSVDASTQFLLDKGSRLQQLMNQRPNSPVFIGLQILLLFGGLNNIFNDIPLSLLNIFESKLSFILQEPFFFLLYANTIKQKLFNKINVYLLNSLKLFLLLNTRKY